MTKYRTTATEKTIAGSSLQPHRTDVASSHPFRLDNLAKKFNIPGFDDLLMTDSRNSQTQTIEQELQAYITGQLSPYETDLMKFWEVCVYGRYWWVITRANIHSMSQINETMFPTLFKIAMDYLPIQATSVPSERVFSSSSEMDTKKRNRIHPTLMEALQMLKFSLKTECLNFTQGWQAPESALSEREYDIVDLLAKLLEEEGDKERVIDEIICDLDDDWL